MAEKLPEKNETEEVFFTGLITIKIKEGGEEPKRLREKIHAIFNSNIFDNEEKRNRFYCVAYSHGDKLYSVSTDASSMCTKFMPHAEVIKTLVDRVIIEIFEECYAEVVDYVYKVESSQGVVFLSNTNPITELCELFHADFSFGEDEEDNESGEDDNEGDGDDYSGFDPINRIFFSDN